jgi:predicted dehydrogenase
VTQEQDSHWQSSRIALGPVVEGTSIMIKVGVCGLGFMGRTHFTVFDQDPRATVVALMDHQPARRNGDWRDPLGNLESGWPSRVDMANRRGYATIEDLCADPEVELVDLTLPTHLHADAAVTALQARKHVLSEKPMALSSKDCKRIVEAAKKSRKYFMVAQCIRFWPQYAKIKELVSSRMYGKVRSLALRRMATPPGYSSGAWLMNHELSGGAIFDLHIHDVDFALYLMGKPKRVTAYGTTGPSGGIDLVFPRALPVRHVRQRALREGDDRMGHDQGQFAAYLPRRQVTRGDSGGRDHRLAHGDRLHALLYRPQEKAQDRHPRVERPVDQAGRVGKKEHRRTPGGPDPLTSSREQASAIVRPSVNRPSASRG